MIPSTPASGQPADAEPGEACRKAAPAAHVNLVRRLYNWVLGWADTPYGTPALAAISFAESSFFPIPPDVLQIALSIARPRRSFYYAAVSAIASVLGGIAGWLIGYALWASVGEFFFNYVPGFSRQNFDHVARLYGDNAFLAIVGAAFTPIPYKLFTVAAGVFQVPLETLIVASAVGRSGRFFAVALVIFFFGAPAKYVLERYFEWITLALFAMLVGGFLAVRYLLG
ncbi:MAG: YqaA family protein [Pirellulales bacterium]